MKLILLQKISIQTPQSAIFYTHCSVTIWFASTMVCKYHHYIKYMELEGANWRILLYFVSLINKHWQLVSLSTYKWFSNGEQHTNVTTLSLWKPLLFTSVTSIPHNFKSESYIINMQIIGIQTYKQYYNLSYSNSESLNIPANLRQNVN